MGRLASWVCVGALVAASLPGCSSSGARLLVDLRTDLRPGVDFVGVRTEYAETRLGSGVLRAELLARSDQDYVDGLRVAEFGEVTPGTRWLRVSLVDVAGEVTASRVTLVRVSGDVGVTVVITRECAGVVCPAPSDAPERTTCSGGRCVDPACGVDGAASCDPANCTTDAECGGALACARGVCVEGECLNAPDDALCASSETCDAVLGCVARPEDGGVGPMDAGPMDAGPADTGAPDTGAPDTGAPDTGAPDTGPGCPAVETACMDGVDDDCDGFVDCADSDCVGATCDDGVWCNGSDTCAAGSCSAHASPPCARFCNETARACDACATDVDCGATSYGSWSACGGYASTCDTTGRRSRSVTTHVCAAGSCGSSASSQSGSCSRSTDGNSCNLVGSCPGICAGGGCAPDGCVAGCPC